MTNFRLPLLAAIAVALAIPNLVRAADSTPDVTRLYGKWLYLSVTKAEEGVEKETQMSRSSLALTEDGEWSQHQWVKDRILSKKGSFRLNKAGSLLLEYEGGKLGPYKITLSDDNKLLTLTGIDETYKLKFKEE